MPRMFGGRVEPSVGSVEAALGVGRRSRVRRRALGLCRSTGRALVEARVLAPALSRAERGVRSAALAARVLETLEVGVVRRGRFVFPDGATLMVANHVSWLDACVVQTLRPARVVVTAEIASWPVVGGICRGFDAIVVRPGDVEGTVREIAVALRAGERVVVFPEAVPTDGRRVGHFHAALLQASIDTGAPVQPVALRWLGLGGRPTPAVARAGERRPGASLLEVLATPHLRAEVRVGTPLSVAGRTRHDLAGLAREFVVSSLGLRDEIERRAVVGALATAC